MDAEDRRLSQSPSNDAPWRRWGLVDFHDVIGSEQAFLADVLLKAEWRDPRLAGRWSGVHGEPLNEVWNPRLQLINQRGVSQALPQRVEIDFTGRVTYRQLFSGRFTARMELFAVVFALAWWG